MTPEQHQKIIDELQDVITQIIDLLDRFEDEGMQTALAKDYEQLHQILAKATKQQRRHIREMITNERLK